MRSCFTFGALNSSPMAVLDSRWRPFLAFGFFLSRLAGFVDDFLVSLGSYRSGLVLCLGLRPYSFPRFGAADVDFIIPRSSKFSEALSRFICSRQLWEEVGGFPHSWSTITFFFRT